MQFRIRKGNKYFYNIWTIHLKRNSNENEKQVIYCSDDRVLVSSFPGECVLQVKVGDKWIDGEGGETDEE